MPWAAVFGLENNIDVSYWISYPVTWLDVFFHFNLIERLPAVTLDNVVDIGSGLIVFTDADGAGLVIRNFIKSAIPAKFLKHAYTPDIFGKERRKATSGKEGKLGVEGMRPEIILEALRRAGATFDDAPNSVDGQISKQDLMELGLSGGMNAAANRVLLLKKLGFPGNMSANSMLQALNLLYTFQELQQIMNTLEKDNGWYPG